MGDKDFSISPVGQINASSGAINAIGIPGSQISKKPSYLIVLEEATTSGKGKSYQRFVAIDKPDLSQGFVQVKGFFTKHSEDEIITNISDILTSTKKELICEMMFPWHKIRDIRSLVFNAIKANILVK